MNGFLIRVLISSALFLGHSGNASENNAKSLINQLPSAWAESTDAFTNVAHKACEVIREIDNPTNRLECAKEYAESIFRLDKFVWECDEDGFRARINVLSDIIDAIPYQMPLALEFKWEIIVRQWLHAREELAHYASFGPILPGRISSGIIIDQEERRKILRKIELENEERRRFARQNAMASYIRGWLRVRYNFTFEHDLKNDCSKLSHRRKVALMRMVIDAIGETPEWYKKELENKKEKRQNGTTRNEHKYKNQ